MPLPKIRENERNHSTAHAKRIQYSRETQENLLGNPQFFNRLPEPYNNQNISLDEVYSSDEDSQIRENERNHSTAHASRIQYSRLTQENLLGNPQFFNRFAEAYNNQNISSDEGYSSDEAPQNSLGGYIRI